MEVATDPCFKGCSVYYENEAFWTEKCPVYGGVLDSEVSLYIEEL